MRRFLSMFLATVSILSLLTVPSAFAQESEANVEQIVRYDDGSCLVISIESVPTRASKITKSKVYTYRDENGNTDWKITLTGSFTYDGTSATCTSSNCTVTIYDTGWYVISKSSSKSGNTAYGTATLGLKVLGVTIRQETYNLTLTCDKNGNVS